jgi:hypothetical protein
MCKSVGRLQKPLKTAYGFILAAKDPEKRYEIDLKINQYGRKQLLIL